MDSYVFIDRGLLMGAILNGGWHHQDGERYPPFYYFISGDRVGIKYRLSLTGFCVDFYRMG
jgi:hypothetical protein